MTRLVHDPRELSTLLDEARRRSRVGLVPTMGALHEGHLALVAEARRHAELIVATIFVNPLQFGPSEDFERYPRTLESDVAACDGAGVDVVFAPSVDAIYPDGFCTEVAVTGGLTDRYEGAVRPGHFRGVTTVVMKLFSMVGACTAVFGRKDYQQWRVVARMVEDLALPVRVLDHPTLREPDGLARSSRNRFLDLEARRRARSIPEGLRRAQSAYADGERDAARLESIARLAIDDEDGIIDYVSAADASTLEPLHGKVRERTVLLVAARFGVTRLIDNVVLGEPDLGPSPE